MNEQKYHNSTAMGIHRVMAEPFDDKTVFDNPIDLLIYARYGASYNGQQVSLLYNNKQIDVVIMNKEPILKLPNVEYYKKFDEKYYVLLYRYNTFKDNKKFDEKVFSVNNPNKFTMIDLLNIFRGEELDLSISYEIDNDKNNLLKYNSNDTLKFYQTLSHDFLFKKIYPDKDPLIHLFTQDIYPFNEDIALDLNKSNFRKITNDECWNYRCEIVDTDNNINKKFSFVSLQDGKDTDAKSVIELYMEADHYVKAMLGER